MAAFSTNFVIPAWTRARVRRAERVIHVKFVAQPGQGLGEFRVVRFFFRLKARFSAIARRLLSYWRRFSRAPCRRCVTKNHRMINESVQMIATGAVKFLDPLALAVQM